MYWNYLAQRPGNDGYGLLALGVVRNDNMPGATANAYAAQTAYSVNHRDLSERQWEMFGRDLIQADLALRTARLKNGNPQAALNLPVKDVQAAHDGAFVRAGITKDAWTPRQLLEAARRHGGDAEAEKVWHAMLDNSAAGGSRLLATLKDLAHHYGDPGSSVGRYTLRLGSAWAAALVSSPNHHPDRIRIGRTDYLHFRDGWAAVAEPGVDPLRSAGMPAIEPVADARLIRQLDDARALRLEREHMRTQFHPDDPARHRGIEKSPTVVADAAPAHDASGLATLDAAARQQLDGIERLVRAHGARTNAGWSDAEIRKLSLGLATMAAADPLVSRVDAVVGNVAMPNAAANTRLFAVHRPYGERERSFHAAVDVRTALAVPEARGIEALAHAAAAAPAPSHGEPAVQRGHISPRHHAHAL